jgi:transposase-like protein
MKLTDEQRQNYLKQDGVRCPYCNTTDIESLGPAEVSSSGVFQDIHCNGCGRNWTDEYTLTGITEED